MLSTEQNYSLSYTEKNHTYILISHDGNERNVRSVTQTIKKYFKPFDKKACSEDVYNKNQENYSSPEDVRREWSHLRHLGKDLHKEIEDYLNDGTIGKHKDFSRFLDFWNSYLFREKGYFVFPEYKIFDSNVNISGTPDCVLINRDGNFIVLDWKRCKKIYKRGYQEMIYDPTKNEVTYKDPIMGKNPFSNFEDCNYTHYSLQLNFYRSILEKHYKFDNKNIRCIGMFLVVFSPNDDKWEIESVGKIDLSGVWTSI